MRERQLRKHIEMERLFGADFVPRRPADPWDELRGRVAACRKCAQLCDSRTQTVFGVGSTQAPVVFIGEAPGEDEDRQGEPFVGRAGQLLTKTLRGLGVERSQVYIANILKCRPPGNRTPAPEEMANCMPFLQEQLKRIAPKRICVMGNVAAQGLLATKMGITKLRGRYHDWNGQPVFATFHPAYILRNMNDLPLFEGDVRQVLMDAGLLH